MSKNKSKDNKRNVCGNNVSKYRYALKGNVSQNKLSAMLCLSGLNVTKNTIQRIENGKRFVSDIEIVHLAKVLNVTYEQLLESDD